MTTPEIQIPGMRQAHKVCSRLNHLNELNLTFTQDSGVTKQT